MNSRIVPVEVQGGDSFQYGDDLEICHIRVL